jgi:3-deoxy-D-manno-octulosonic acid kinase
MSWTSRYADDAGLREFACHETGGARILVRHGFERLMMAAPEAPAGPWVIGRTGGGRGAHPVVELPGGERVLLREYRRGGAVRHVNRATYFFGHRALEELRVTVAAEIRGVSVPRMIAAVERPGRVGYSAMLAVGWIDGAVDLARWVEAVPAERVETMRSVGEAIARMHDAGVAHPDLNLQNLLITPGPGGARRVVIIDFDRARLYGRPLSARLRRAAIQRMTRSAWSLGAPIGIPETEAFAAGYGANWPFPSPHG